MLALVVVLGGLPARHVSRRTTPALAALGQLGGWAPDGGRAVMTTSTAPNLATLATGTTPNRHGLAAGHVARHGALRTAGDVGPDVPSLFAACIAAGRRTRVVLGDPRLAGVLGVGADALCELDGDPRPPAGQRRGAVATDDAIVTDDAVVATVAHRFDDPADLTVALLGLPDAAAAQHGPDSSAALDAYRATDDRLATLRDHLDRRWRELVIMVVSDHDQEPVDPRFPPVDIARAAADRDLGLQVATEGGAALVAGADPTQGRWLAELAGVAGSLELGPAVRIAWARPGRVFDDQGHPLPGSVHGGPGATTQVAVVSGGHPAVARMAAAVARRSPNGADWAVTLAQLLGVALPTATGRSLLSA